MNRHPHDTSQNGESTILLELFDKIGTKGKQFIDLGAGDSIWFSNTNLFRHLGWEGYAIDADNKGSRNVTQEVITKDNILDILDLPFQYQLDLLSIDIDGNDYWILDTVLDSYTQLYKPRVIIFEVNSQLPLNEPLVRPYTDELWDGSNLFGMSYAAFFLWVGVCLTDCIFFRGYLNSTFNRYHITICHNIINRIPVSLTEFQTGCIAHSKPVRAVP